MEALLKLSIYILYKHAQIYIWPETEQNTANRSLDPDILYPMISTQHRFTSVILFVRYFSIKTPGGWFPISFFRVYTWTRYKVYSFPQMPLHVEDTVSTCSHTNWLGLQFNSDKPCSNHWWNFLS